MRTFVYFDVLRAIIIRWVLPESPRWLLAMGRVQEVMTVLQKAARMNKRQLSPDLDKQLTPTAAKLDQESGSVLDLFKTKQILTNTLLLFVIWFSVYLVYYGLVLNLSNIGGDLYINSVSTQHLQYINGRMAILLCHPIRYYQALLKFLLWPSAF